MTTEIAKFQSGGREVALGIKEVKAYFCSWMDGKSNALAIRSRDVVSSSPLTSAITWESQRFPSKVYATLM